MASDEDDSLVTVVTCEGNLTDPDFPYKLSSLVARLRSILPSGEKPFNVTNVEPWNSVRVTFTIPREAAQRLRQLAQQGDRALRDLGILSVQIEGDQVISLTIAGRFNEPQEIVLRSSTSSEDARSIASTASQSVELDVGSPVPSNVETTRKSIAQYLGQQGGGLAVGGVLSATATTSSVNAAIAVPSAGDFKSPNVVAPGSDPIPFPPKGKLHPSPSRAAPNFGPFPFASMTYAMNTMHGSSSATSSASSSLASSSSSSSTLATASSPSSSAATASATSSSLRFPFSPPPPPYPGTSSMVVVPGAFQSVRSLVPQSVPVINNLPKKKLIAERANAALASPLLVNLLQSDVGTSPPSHQPPQGFKVFPTPTTEPSATAILPTKRKRKPRKSKEKPSSALTSEGMSGSSMSPGVSPASSPSLVSTLGTSTSTDGCHFLQPFNIALPNLSPPPLTPPSSSSPPSLNAGQAFTSVDGSCTTKPPLVSSNQRIPALPSPPQTAASSSSSSSAASTSNNSGQSSQETELSPWPSPSKRTQHLVNPFTGQLEPMSSDDDDDDDVAVRPAPLRENTAPLLDASGPFSEVGLKTGLSPGSCRPRGVVAFSNKGSTSSHMSSSSSSASTSSSPSPPPPPQQQPCVASSVSVPAAAVSVSTSSSLSEKIKLRLKLEPKPRMEKEKKEVKVDGTGGGGGGGGGTATLGLQYKVDVSFVNIPTSVAPLRRGSGGSAPMCLSTSATTQGVSSMSSGLSASRSLSPVASPSAPEPRVPPLHISLRGRNATVVVNPRREDRDCKMSTTRDAGSGFEGEIMKPQRSRSPRNSRQDGPKSSIDSKAHILSSGRRNAASRGGISVRRGRGTVTTSAQLQQEAVNVPREKALLSGGSMFVETSMDSTTMTTTATTTSATVSTMAMAMTTTTTGIVDVPTSSRTTPEDIKAASSLPQAAVVSSVLIPRQVVKSQSKNPSIITRRPHSFSGRASTDNLGMRGYLKNTSNSDSEHVDEEGEVKLQRAASFGRETMQLEMVPSPPPPTSFTDKKQAVKSFPMEHSELDRPLVRTTTAASPLIVKGVTVGTPCFGLNVSEVINEPISVTSPQCQQEKSALTSSELKMEVEDRISSNDDVNVKVSATSPRCSGGGIMGLSAEVRSEVVATTTADIHVASAAPCELTERRTSSVAPTSPTRADNVSSLQPDPVEADIPQTAKLPRLKSDEERTESVLHVDSAVCPVQPAVQSSELNKCATEARLSVVKDEDDANRKRDVSLCVCRENVPSELQKPDMPDESLVKLVCGITGEENVLPRQVKNCVEGGYLLVPTLDTRKALVNNVDVTVSLDAASKMPRVSKAASLVTGENLRIAAVVGASGVATSHFSRPIGCLSEDTEVEGIETDVMRHHGILNSATTRSLITVVSASPSSASPSGSSPDSLHIGTSSEDNGDSNTGTRSHGLDNRMVSRHHHHNHHHNHHNLQHGGRCNSSNGSPYEDSGIDSMDAMMEKLSGGESPEDDARPLPQQQHQPPPPPSSSITNQNHSRDHSFTPNELESDFWHDRGGPSEVKTGEHHPGTASCDAQAPSRESDAGPVIPVPDADSSKDSEAVQEQKPNESQLFSTENQADILTVLPPKLEHVRLEGIEKSNIEPVLTNPNDAPHEDVETSDLMETKPVLHDDAQYSDEDRIPHLVSIAEKEFQDGLEGSSNLTSKSESNSPSPPSLEKIAPLTDCCQEASHSEAEFTSDDIPLSSLAAKERFDENSKEDLPSFEFEGSDVEKAVAAEESTAESMEEYQPESTQLLVFTVQDVDSIMVTENEGLLEISDVNGTKLDLSVLKDEQVADLDEALDVYLDRHFSDGKDDRLRTISEATERDERRDEPATLDETGLTTNPDGHSTPEVSESTSNINKVETSETLPIKEQEAAAILCILPEDRPNPQIEEERNGRCAEASATIKDGANLLEMPAITPSTSNVSVLSELIAADNCSTQAAIVPCVSVAVNENGDDASVPQGKTMVSRRSDIVEDGPSLPMNMPTASLVASVDSNRAHHNRDSDEMKVAPMASSVSSTHARLLLTNRTWLVPHVAPSDSSTYSPPPTLDPHAANDDPPHLQSPFLDLAASANSCGDEDDEAEPFPRLSPAVDFDDGHPTTQPDDDDDDSHSGRDDFDSSSCESAHQREFKDDMDDLYMGNTSITSGDHNYIVRSSSSVNVSRERSRVNDTYGNNLVSSNEVNHSGGDCALGQLSIEIPETTQENVATERRMTRSTRSSSSRLASPSGNQQQQQQQQTSPNIIASQQSSPAGASLPLATNSSGSGSGGGVSPPILPVNELHIDNDSGVVRTLPNRSAAKRKRCEDSSSESMDSTTTTSTTTTETLYNDINKVHSGRSKSPVVVEMTAHFYSKPVKRKCSENAVELIKACIGVDDNPKRTANAKHHHPNSEALKLHGGGGGGAASVVSAAVPLKNAKSKDETTRSAKAGCGHNSTPSGVIGSEESSDDEVTLSELATKTRSGRTGNTRNAKLVRQQQHGIVGGSVSGAVSKDDEATTTTVMTTTTSRGEQRTANSRNSVTNNRKDGAAGRSGCTGVGTSRASRNIEKNRRTETPPLPNTRGHDRSPQRSSHRSRATTRDHVASPTPHNQSSREDGVTTGRRKLRSSTSSVSGYYDTLPQKRRRMSRDHR